MVHNPTVIRETLFLKLLTKLFVCFFGVVDTIVGSLVVCGVVYRGYYTVARRYEFYVRVARTISHE